MFCILAAVDVTQTTAQPANTVPAAPSAGDKIPPAQEVQCIVKINILLVNFITCTFQRHRDLMQIFFVMLKHCLI